MSPLQLALLGLGFHFYDDQQEDPASPANGAPAASAEICICPCQSPYLGVKRVVCETVTVCVAALSTLCALVHAMHKTVGPSCVSCDPFSGYWLPAAGLGPYLQFVLTGNRQHVGATPTRSTVRWRMQTAPKSVLQCPIRILSPAAFSCGQGAAAAKILKHVNSEGSCNFWPPIKIWMEKHNTGRWGVLIYISFWRQYFPESAKVNQATRPLTFTRKSKITWWLIKNLFLVIV